MTIRATILDIGGVLEMTPDPQMTGLIERWGKRLHLKPGELAERHESMGDSGTLGTCTEEEWLHDLRAVTGMDQAQCDEFIADFWVEYLGELNVELAAFIATLRPRHKIALLSNSFLGARGQERNRFQEMTDLSTYSHEAGLAKPDRRIFQLVCERLGLPPHEAIFLDDHEPNIAAAREFGIHAILFRDTGQAIAEICALLQDSNDLYEIIFGRVPF
jgi:epoxide hydrolase-like predicted phosphatase